MVQNKPAPFDWSNYQRTYNNAIDLVAQCVGYHRKTRKPIKAIILKPSYHDLFRAGIAVLSKKELDPLADLFFDGVEIKRGNGMQFDSLRCEYYPTGLPNPQLN